MPRLLVTLALFLVASEARAAECLEKLPMASPQDRVRFEVCSTPPPRPGGGCRAELRGVTFPLELEGRRATIWVGVDPNASKDNLAIQLFNSEGASPVCHTFTTDADEESYGGLSVKPQLFEDPPRVRVSAFAQSGCSSYSGGMTVGCLLLAERCEVLEPWKGEDTLRGQCREEGEEPTREEKARRREYERAEALHARGLAALKRKDFKAAEALLEQAAPRSVAALNDLGFLHAGQKRYVDAERALLQTIARDPGRVPAHLNLADLYWERGKQETAKALYRRYMRALRDNLREGEIAKPVPRAVQRAGEPEPAPAPEP